MKEDKSQEMELIPYNIETKVISELKTKYLDITIPPDDKAAYDMVMAGLRETRELRLSCDAWHKERKALILKAGRFYDSEKKRIHDLIEPVEDHLKTVRKIEDDRKEAIKQEKIRLEEERVSGIRTKISEIQKMTIGLNGLSADQLRDLESQVSSMEITDGEFAEFALEATQAKEEVENSILQAIELRIRLDKEEEERKAEAERLAKIQAEQEAERARLEAENARLEEIRKAEERRMAEEQAKIDAANRKIAEEKAAIKAEKKAEQARKDREELEKRLAAEAKVKAEQEAKAKAEREEAERVAREKAEAEEAARQESLKPDKVKLADFASSLNGIDMPNVFSKEAVEIAEAALDRVGEIAEWVNVKIETM